MSVEGRLQVRAKQLAKDRNVKCCCQLYMAHRWLQSLWRPINHPGERSPNGCVSSVSENVLCHRTMSKGLETSTVQGSKKYTVITIPHVCFSSGRLCQPPQDRFHNTA